MKKARAAAVKHLARQVAITINAYFESWKNSVERTKNSNVGENSHAGFDIYHLCINHKLAPTGMHGNLRNRRRRSLLRHLKIYTIAKRWFWESIMLLEPPMERVQQASKLKLFISYSRRDSAAADELVEALQARGFEVTIDRRDLPFGEKWQAELAEFIRLSDTVIWLVSEHSVRSEWVNWELDEVARRAKRLVPVMVRDTARDRLPRQLGEIHILPAEGIFDLARDLDTLVQVLETDRAWLKEASRLQDRATEWLAKGRSSALLLSRGALEAAGRWKESRPPKAPPPAQEVLDLLLASRQAATRRQRWWVADSAAVTVFALALAGFAYVQRNTAIGQRNEAQSQRRVTQELREQTQKTESGLLAQAASDMFGDGKDWAKISTAALLALEALPAAADFVRPPVAETEWQLDRANRELRELTDIGHEDKVNAASFSMDGSKIITASDDSSARVWDAATGKELARLSHEEKVSAASFSPDGSRIVTASAWTAHVWNAATGEELVGLSYERWVGTASFSPDATRVITGWGDIVTGGAVLWDAATGKELARLGHESAVTAASFGPNTSAGYIRIVTASGNSAYVWQVGSSADGLVQIAKRRAA